MHGSDDITENLKVCCFRNGISDDSKGKHPPRNINGSFTSLEIGQSTIYNKTYKR